MSDELDALFCVVERLEAAGVAYMLSGSMALSLYARPRMTRDIDIVVELDRTGVRSLVEAFESGFYLDESMALDAVSAGSMFNVLHERTLMKIDFIVRKNSEYRRNEFARRTDVRIGKRSVAVVAIEDLILSKLLWARDAGGSEQQESDVRALLRNDSIDAEYLGRWSGVLGVEAELARVRP